MDSSEFLARLRDFLDSLSGELNGALNFLKRLEGRPKGSGFAYEMQFDKHRYGALIALERWARFASTIPAEAQLGPYQPLATEAARKSERARELLEKLNHVIDDPPDYRAAVVDACAMTFQTVDLLFEEERRAVYPRSENAASN